MSKIAESWSGLHAWLWRYRAQVKLSLRVTVAALLALALAQWLLVRLPLWVVLTAVIVSQMSIGRSLKAATDYITGTLGGAIYGGAIAVLIPHTSQIALLAVLGLAVAPLALLAAINPSLAVAPVTAIIVLLVPEITNASPMTSIIDRLIEVGLGSVTGLVVSLVLLPSSAHRLVAETAAHVLDRMARALGGLLSQLTRGLDFETLHRLQDGIGRTLTELQAVGAEAERERLARLSYGTETGPLLRTLLRLRHDIVIIGRAAIVPLPEDFRPRLEPPLAQCAAALTEYLKANGAALLARRGPPSLDAVHAALEVYDAAIAALRHDGMTRRLSGDAAERLFAIGFALEQMRQNLKDLARVVSEWAERPVSAGAAATQGVR